jgi:tetratricopeptide (TPR) repeat protein
MDLQRHHWLIIGGAALFLILYFGFSIKSSKSAKDEISRSLVSQVMSPEGLIVSSKTDLDNAALKNIEMLEQRLKQSDSETDRLKTLEELASNWYRNGNAAASGVYAEKIAEIKKESNAWSIAGTTFILCLQSETDQKVKTFCASKSRAAFENAISLDPDKVSHRVNLALSYVEMPPEDNPMKGILMLRELQEKHPENATILFNLGRLAIQTGQFDRAIERLEEALKIEPGSKSIACMLSKAYEGAGKPEKAAQFAANCE